MCKLKKKVIIRYLLITSANQFYLGCTLVVKFVNSLKISAIVSPVYLESLFHYSTLVLMS